MAVLETLGKLATGYDPEARFLKSVERFSNVLGAISAEQRIRNFGHDLIYAIEGGEEVDQGKFLNLMQRNRLKPEEADFALNLLQKSGAVTEALRKSKLGKTKLGTIAQAPMQATAEQYGAFPSTVLGSLFPNQTTEKPERLYETEQGLLPRSQAIGRKPFVKPSVSETMDEDKAIQRIENINKIIAELRSTKGVDPAKLAILRLSDKDLANRIVQGADVKDLIGELESHKAHFYKKYVNESLWPESVKNPSKPSTKSIWGKWDIQE